LPSSSSPALHAGNRRWNVEDEDYANGRGLNAIHSQDHTNSPGKTSTTPSSSPPSDALVPRNVKVRQALYRLRDLLNEATVATTTATNGGDDDEFFSESVATAAALDRLTDEELLLLMRAGIVDPLTVFGTPPEEQEQAIEQGVDGRRSNVGASRPPLLGTTADSSGAAADAQLLSPDKDTAEQSNNKTADDPREVAMVALAKQVGEDGGEAPAPGINTCADSSPPYKGMNGAGGDDEDEIVLGSDDRAGSLASEASALAEALLALEAAEPIVTTLTEDLSGVITEDVAATVTKYRRGLYSQISEAELTALEARDEQAADTVTDATASPNSFLRAVANRDAKVKQSLDVLDRARRAAVLDPTFQRALEYTNARAQERFSTASGLRVRMRRKAAEVPLFFASPHSRPPPRADVGLPRPKPSPAERAAVRRERRVKKRKRYF
jgi:hypothetical protein